MEELELGGNVSISNSYVWLEAESDGVSSVSSEPAEVGKKVFLLSFIKCLHFQILLNMSVIGPHEEK